MNSDVYLAAGQVQGSVPVLIQQCQVGLRPMKEDGYITPTKNNNISLHKPLRIIVSKYVQQTYSRPASDTQNHDTQNHVL